MKQWQQNWRAGLLPGLSITGFVILARLLGALQPLEWKALDISLRWRPAEVTDSRVTVVAITEKDIQTTLGHPIADGDLAALIDKLQTYSPRAIGIDIFRDRPVRAGYEDLKSTLSAADNAIGIYTIESPVIAPAPMLSDHQIGFADASVDNDGGLRRSLLANADEAGNYHFSLTLQLAQTYLDADSIALENGIRDPETMRFGETEIPRFQPSTGGYVRTDNGGNQALINFRAGPQPFAQVSYAEVMSGQVSPDLLQNRALLIGYTAESVKDYENSGVIANSNPSAIPGIVIQAHALSQILSAVYDDRSFIQTLPNPIEYLLIIGTGLLGISLAYWQRKPGLHLLLVAAASAVWLLFIYAIAIASWWLPLVPTLTVFLLNAIALYPFYQAQSQLQSQIKEQDKLIDQTYTTIHNGPLQIIARMLSTWPDGQPAEAEMRSRLQELNHELRGIREVLQKEMRSPSEKLAMMGDQIVDLQMPLHMVLYETYSNTLSRYRSFFEPMAKIRSFEPMADSRLTGREKRAIGRFLEEALTNVFKYAKGATRVTVTSQRTSEYNLVQIIDNGEGELARQQQTYEGYGTQQANRIARQLGGKFERTVLTPKGVCCELRWPIQLSAWQRWRKQI